MIRSSIIQKPAPLGRKGAENGILLFYDDTSSFLLQGERIHGETLTVDVPCSTGKDSYPTYEAAQKALRMKSRSGQRSKRIYKCKECGCYHFTTNDGSMRKARPYQREKEKEAARKLTNAYSIRADLVSTDGFSMKRFRNYLNRMRVAI